MAKKNNWLHTADLLNFDRSGLSKGHICA